MDHHSQNSNLFTASSQKKSTAKPKERDVCSSLQFFQLAQLSARVQSSYMSTKPSKMHRAELSNHSQQNFNNMKSWLQNFETQKHWMPNVVEGFQISPKNLQFEGVTTAVGNGRQRMREQLLSDHKKNEVLNPKTSQGKRGMLNRSIGYIQNDLNASTQQMLNYGSSNVTHDSKVLPSLLGISDDLSQIGSKQVDYSKFFLKAQHGSARASIDRERHLLQQKNRQITNEQVMKLKEQTNKRRSISILGAEEDSSTEVREGIQLHEGVNKELKHASRTALDTRVVEQWLNDTLHEAEEYKIPGSMLKSDQMNPISRYGIDRITLTNAGIPNDEVTHLYRSLFVYSIGFYNLIKEIVNNCKELYLGAEGRTKHMTKFSIITAVWKVFQILLEFTYRADYKLLITKIQEDHQEELKDRERDFDKIMLEQKQEQMKLEKKVHQLQFELESVQKEKVNERNHRIRIEEELQKNQKTHEDEVNLRLKFEEKLNNLHALNRITNQNLANTSGQLQNVQSAFDDLQVHFKGLQLELAAERVKASSYEQKFMYAEDRSSVLQAEVSEKSKHNERLVGEMSETVDQFEIINYKYQTAVKDQQAEKARVQKLEDENKHLTSGYQYYKAGYEDFQAKVKVLNGRIEELIDLNQKYHMELSFYKQEFVGFDTANSIKTDKIGEMRSEQEKLQGRINELEDELGEARARYLNAEQELGTVKSDYQGSVEKLEKINKARQESENLTKEKMRQNQMLNQKLKDREETIQKNLRKIHELDEKVGDFEQQVNMLEKDKAQIRIEADQIKRQQMDKIHTLEEMNRNEKDLRANWTDRFEKETRALSCSNVEMMEIKTKIAESESKVKHVDVELRNERHMTASLIKSKKELMSTLNTYIVKCESQESDLYAMREVNKHFESMKEIEFKELKDKVRHLLGYINCLQLNVEDYYTRCALYSEQIMKCKSSILRVGLELTFSKRLVLEMKDKLSDQLEHIDTLEDKQRKQDDEIIVSRNSYKIMKSRIQGKEEEIEAVQKQLQDSQDHLAKIQDKKRLYKRVKDELFDELSVIKEIRSGMENKLIQATVPLQEQEIQCVIVVAPPNLQQPNVPNMQNYSYKVPQVDRHEQSKLEKAAKKQAKRDLVLGSTKMQNQLNKQYDLKSGNYNNSAQISTALVTDGQNKTAPIKGQSEANSLRSSKNAADFTPGKLKEDSTDSPPKKTDPQQKLSNRRFTQQPSDIASSQRKLLQFQQIVDNQVLEYGESDVDSLSRTSKDKHPPEEHTPLQVLNQDKSKSESRPRTQLSSHRKPDPQQKIKNLLRHAFHERT